MFSPIFFRAALSLGVAAVAVALFPVFGSGADVVSIGGRVVLVNQTFKCSNYPQPIDFDLVKVTIEAGQASRMDGLHTSGSGSECTGRIGRLEIDTWNSDGVKVHQPAHDLVIEGGYVRCHDRRGSVHQDGIQAMGGTRVTFRNLEVDCAGRDGVGINSAMFINEGAGGNGRPTEVICDGCTLKKATTRNNVLRIHDSLRSGARNSTIVWCGKGPECGAGPAVFITGRATDPVNENNRIVPHTGDPAPAPPPPEPGPPALKLSRFELSTVRPSAGGRLFALLGVSGMPQVGSKSVVTCLAAVRGKAVNVVGSSSRGGDTRCAFAVPKSAKGRLLTGLVGVTNRGSTVNRSFTLRVADPGRQTASAGRIATTLVPAPSGVSLRSFVLSNQGPVAGKRIFASITLAPPNVGGGTVRCAGVAGGKPLRVLGSSLKAPAASCGWLIPTGVARKPVRFSITVTTQGSTFTHSFHLAVRP